MHVSAHLDVDLVAVEQDDAVTVMLELTAPAATDDQPRPAATVQVVLDRSGSMSGDPLFAAKLALTRLIDRLDPTDNFGVVAFDDDATVIVPAGPLTDKAAARDAVAQIEAGCSTNLSAGYLRGLQEARRVCDRAGATIVVLSDGEANQGILDASQLTGIAARAQQQAITTTTIGIGLGYDEQLLAAMSAGGAGNHAFAEGADDAGPALLREVDGLLTTTVQAASLRMTLAESVTAAFIKADLPLVIREREAFVELGDLWAGEERKVLLRFGIPAIAALGLAQVATIELRYVVLPELREEIVTLPITVNVVPADLAAGRVADPRVAVESLFQEAQNAKTAATKSLRQGDAVAASRQFFAASQAIRAASVSSPELAAEADLLDDLSQQALDEDPNRLSKLTTTDIHNKTIKRGQGGSAS
ncbi:MAG TPA: VWA domain-containing protein [Mycobacteriales bacterium]|nr:VWA domain-containing protein [Mycobacteriales bacterium]